MQKNTLKKLKHGETVKPAFKYIIDLIEENKKIRRRVDRHNQINLKKAGIQTDRLNLASKKITEKLMNLRKTK